MLLQGCDSLDPPPAGAWWPLTAQPPPPGPSPSQVLACPCCPLDYLVLLATLPVPVSPQDSLAVPTCWPLLARLLPKPALALSSWGGEGRPRLLPAATPTCHGAPATAPPGPALSQAEGRDSRADPRSCPSGKASLQKPGCSPQRAENQLPFWHPVVSQAGHCFL